MMRFFVLALYNLLLPVFFVLSFPGWLLKMARRGGIGTGLLERFSLFKRDALFEKQGVIYIHAVSVGEVLIAIKLIKEWLLQHPNERILLVPTTATGHAVAKEYAPEGVRVIYSPLDFSWIVKRVLRRFEPKQIILMESEIWPNLLNVANKLKIPVNIANARLSQRSEARYKKVGFLLRPLLEMLHILCAQDEGDKKRWQAVGVKAEKIVVTGSVKFDQSGGAAPTQRGDFAQMLEATGGGKKVVMALSTHAGEEAWIASALKPLADKILLAIVPRHAERRQEVKQELTALGYEVVLRSVFSAPREPARACLVIDSTGELRQWTAHADVAIIGKSILGMGGQNPTEAIAADVPVIVGPNMQNFEPLISDIKRHNGVLSIETQDELRAAVVDLLEDEQLRQRLTTSSKMVLESHQGATARTVATLSTTSNESVTK